MHRTLAATVLTICVLSGISHAGVGRAVARGASRSVVKSAERGAARAIERKAEQRAAQVLRKDIWNHSHTQVRPLPEPRTVHRYTSSSQATQELKSGIAPGNHMSATARPGRTPSPDTARQRFGLSRSPEVRETVVLPKGFPVRHNKVPGGQPGTGEITSPKRVPSTAVKKVTPLR